MSNLVDFAEEELNRILKSCTDSEALKMQKSVNKDILDIIKLFSKQGHSGFSAGYCLNILKRILDYKPISALTGEDDEWVELNYTPDIAYQNKRCPSVFKDADGKAYNVEGKIFSDDNGHTWYTNGDSRIYIEFPYSVPDRPEYIIIDNQQERQSIQVNICNIIISLGGKVDKFDDVKDNTLLVDLLDKCKFNELEKILIETYNITKPIFSLQDGEIKMWEVINFVMKSDKDEKEKLD